MVIDERPDIYDHNVETVARLFKQIQPQDRYEYAMTTLSNAKKLCSKQVTKSGLMLGLGETFDEVVETMLDLRAVGVDILTLGQYLQPTKQHVPIARYYTPDEFVEFKRLGLEMGFRWVESAPLVRSSYNAERQARELQLR
jgi:lipoic acid synthetase